MDEDKPQPDAARKTRVAIVGTGLAGLTTAYLLQNDDKRRYEVTLFEQVSSREKENLLSARKSFG
jgi:2-polyprenyl-6-methoxyphenol hydroxylase-like FAD-dependent oxidoreductase